MHRFCSPISHYTEYRISKGFFIIKNMINLSSVISYALSKLKVSQNTLLLPELDNFIDVQILSK